MIEHIQTSCTAKRLALDKAMLAAQKIVHQKVLSLQQGHTPFWQLPKDEIKPKVSLEIVLEEPLLLQAFSEFAMTERTTENILFLCELKEIGSIPLWEDPTYYNSRVRKVTRMYISHGSLQQVNLPDGVRTQIETDVKEHCQDHDAIFDDFDINATLRRDLNTEIRKQVPQRMDKVFHVARAEIFRLCQRDILPRFKAAKVFDSAIDAQIVHAAERARIVHEQTAAVLKEKKKEQTFSQVFSDLTAKNLLLIGEDDMFNEARKREVVNEGHVANEKALKKVGEDDLRRHQENILSKPLPRRLRRLAPITESESPKKLSKIFES